MQKLFNGSGSSHLDDQRYIIFESIFYISMIELLEATICKF